MGLFCVSSWGAALAQTISFENRQFDLVNVHASLVQLNGQQVLKVERDLERLPFEVNNLAKTVDEPTFVKLRELDFQDGTIEVKVLSRLQEPLPFEAARGFIGLAYRIDARNSAFESIYLRPLNGRADNQFMRNHSVQYYAYPNYKFNRLREESNGEYETYADVGLSEWITLRIEVKGRKAQLYINNQKHPSFIVNEMLGSTTSGALGLWVDIGTVGYFKDFKVVSK